MRSTDGRGKPRNARVYRTVILLVSVVYGGAAIAQTNNPPVSPASPNAGNTTNVVSSSTNVVTLAPTTVVGKLDTARSQIVPDLGATTYTVNQAQIATMPGGENAAFNQVLLRTPGMVQDSPPTATCTSAASTPISSTASTTCCCPRALADLVRNLALDSWTAPA